MNEEKLKQECLFEKTVREFFGWNEEEALTQEVEADFTCLTNLVCFAYENLIKQTDFSIGNLYSEALFDFLVFIREKNYNIINADDKDLSFIVQRFLHKDEPELCRWCGDVVPNHKEGCKVLKSNIK